MSRISIELVPRNYEVLEADLKTVVADFPDIDTVNVPDIMRFSIRSWLACNTARQFVSNAIPHIRSIDFNMKEAPEDISSIIEDNKLSEVLVVTGDAPQDLSRKVYRTSSTSLIAYLKKNFPKLKVYAAIDPYRSGLKHELDYIQKKKDVGADGFFTQPFFDTRFMDLYAEQLNGSEIYWGVSPVMGDRSRSYWENRNNAFFPADFEPTLEWNRKFAKEALDFAKGRNDNIYFMPIKTSLTDYLGGILN
ncbi:MAG: methylenetetrahydrofolate reductase [Lentisphaeraceae bacterium]|nr:methylenetetrahydrofolate reductase [Lentisphaeraceae bacterium]